MPDPFDIITSLWQTPRAQFSIFYNNRMNPATQREIVSYRTTRAGAVRRSAYSANAGNLVTDHSVLCTLFFNDLRTYKNCYYRFTTAPVIGMYPRSEDNEYLEDYQSLQYQPVQSLLITTTRMFSS